MKRSEILDAARKCVCGDREQDYGSPEDSFRTICELWEVYIREKCLGTPAMITILPEDVAAMMALLKIARIAGGHSKDDNWVDLAGYAACGGELESLEVKLERTLWRENRNHQPESDQTSDMPKVEYTA